MDFKTILNNTRQTLTTGFQNLCSNVKQIWATIRQKIKNLWGSFRSLFDSKEDHPVLSEEERRKRVTAAIHNLLGEKPLRYLSDCDLQERKSAVEHIVQEVAESLGMYPPTVNIKNIENGYSGFYSFSTGEITINISEVNRSPMDEDEAAELLDTILHEMYHAFQHKATIRPIYYGVDDETSTIWENNLRNYISIEQNPHLYWLQPVEESARLFAHAVVVNC